MKISTIEEIKQNILLGKIQRRNFPKAIAFKFDDLYAEIVTQIKTIEISSECILYDSIEAVNENKEYADADYWKMEPVGYAGNYWFFAQNGQGDLWLFDANNKVFFYDHNCEEFAKENFVDLGIDFSKWLQYAFLNQEFDKLYEEDRVDDKNKKDYENKLSELSELLLANYPFEI